MRRMFSRCVKTTPLNRFALIVHGIATLTLLRFNLKSITEISDNLPNDVFATCRRKMLPTTVVSALIGCQLLEIKYTTDTRASYLPLTTLRRR